MLKSTEAQSSFSIIKNETTKNNQSKSPTYSLPNVVDFTEYLQDHYPIEKIKKCFLLNSGLNDIYLIKTMNEKKYIARIGNKKSVIPINTEYELTFINHLYHHGAPVANYMETREAESWSNIRLGNQDRTVVLFNFIKGDRVTHGSSLEAHALGNAIGKIHHVGGSYLGPESQIDINAEYLLDRPAKTILGSSFIDSSHKLFIDELLERLRFRLSKVERDLTIGRCHGDSHCGNSLLRNNEANEREAVFFDFECAGPGWLVYDLATFFRVRSSDKWGAHSWHSFLDGYRQVHSMKQEDHHALPLFILIRQVWAFGVLISIANRIGAQHCSSKKVKKLVRSLARFESRHFENLLI